MSNDRFVEYSDGTLHEFGTFDVPFSDWSLHSISWKMSKFFLAQILDRVRRRGFWSMKFQEVWCSFRSLVGIRLRTEDGILITFDKWWPMSENSKTLRADGSVPINGVWLREGLTSDRMIYDGNANETPDHLFLNSSIKG